MTCSTELEPTTWLLSAGMMVSGLGLLVSGVGDLYTALRRRDAA